MWINAVDIYASNERAGDQGSYFAALNLLHLALMGTPPAAQDCCLQSLVSIEEAILTSLT